MDVASPSLFLAFGAGVLSFLSPCCFPLFPSYLSYISGVSIVDLAEGGRRTRLLAVRHALFFILGFSVIFVALGLGASLLGQFFLTNQKAIRWVGGLLIIFMGLVLLGVIRIPILMREHRFRLANRPSGYLGSMVVGLSFAAGWTPCIGPILASVLFLAGSQPAIGAFLLLAYSAGFAIPLLALAWGISSMRWLGKYTGIVEKVGGTLMVGMGLLLVTNRLSILLAYLVEWTGFQGF